MTNYQKDRLLEILYFVVSLLLGGWLMYQTLPVSTLGKLGIYKSETFVELSGFGAAAAYMVQGLLFLRVSIAWLFPGWHMKEFRLASVDIKARIWVAIIVAIALVLHAAISKA